MVTLMPSDTDDHVRLTVPPSRASTWCESLLAVVSPCT
jgi:hypothetical protein